MGVSLTINECYVMFCQWGLKVRFWSFGPSPEGRFLIIEVKEGAKV